MGVLLVTVRRWILPVGRLTLILATSMLVAILVHENFYLLRSPSSPVWPRIYYIGA